MISIFIIFCSWTMPNSNLFNANSWGISIGKKDLLASWKNNEMGDTAVLDKKKLKHTDTLFVQRYLCGQSGQNSLTTLTIKNEQNEIVKEAISNDSRLMFTAKMAVSDFLTSTKLGTGQMLSVYFTIDSKVGGINQTVLLGRLKLK